MALTRRPTIRLLVFTLLILGFAWLIRTCFPFKPDDKPLPNPVADRGLKDWSAEEAAVPEHPQKQLLWGDLHVHTNLSFDAYLGGTLASPADAYRYAKGRPVNIFNRPTAIERPLDFAAVTDHSELMGEMFAVQNKGVPGYNTFVARYFRSVYNDNKLYGVDTVRQRDIFRRVLNRGGRSSRRHPGFFRGFETTMNAWEVNLTAAEQHYDPGRFTTFAGFEWSLLSGNAHLHRNVIFRDMTVPDYPLSSLELDHEEALWNWLDSITLSGCTVMAIPHNTNLAEGMAFSDKTARGEDIDRAYALLRQDMEPIIEMHQAKGNSEVHAAFWKNDEFADFENYSSGPPKENNYVRWALKRGLEHRVKLGVNPYKFGVIGSTDTHSGTPGNTEESDTFLSNHAIMDYVPEGRRHATWVLDRAFKVYEVLNPGGLVAVWAPANTRGHIYDALKSKEVYATSGSRLDVRFFGGWGFEDTYTDDSSLIADGYRLGVPMGGDLEPTGVAPQFIVRVKKDSLSANLDRIQIVKGWYKGDGPPHERIYNVAVSDGRSIDARWQTEALDAPVNRETGAWSREHGAETLQVTWTDPDYDPEAYAFYYVRTLEIPKANWRLWDNIRYGTKFPEGTTLTVQDRAWSSPIWINPASMTPNF